MYCFNIDASNVDYGRWFSLAARTIFSLWKSRRVLPNLLMIIALLSSPAYGGERSKRSSAPAMAHMTAKIIDPAAKGLEMNSNRPGKDYKNFDLSTPDPKACRAACEKDPQCRAFTYVKPGVQGPKARCWLKSGVPPAKYAPCCVSGVVAAGSKSVASPSSGKGPTGAPSGPVPSAPAKSVPMAPMTGKVIQPQQVVTVQFESKLLQACNLDTSVPDIVERWAPEIWHDYAVSKCDPSITNVDFDSDWRASNNSWFKAPALGAVYYSLVQSPTHYFIGYYFYHPSDCSEWFDGGGHDNDWEGVVIALNRKSNMPDAILTNYHGNLLSYYPPYYAPALAKKGSPIFTLVNKKVKSIKFLTIGVGVEARTHATWGQWNHNCVIGPKYGKTSGCTDKGGDGFIYTYKGYGEVPKVFSQYPNWQRYGYRLIDIEVLFKRAHSTDSCGQDSFDATFACTSHGVPWSIMNGGGDDAGALPWIWGVSGENDCNACDKSSVLLDPASIFWEKFSWKSKHFYWKKTKGSSNYPGPPNVNKYLFQISKCK